MSEQSSEIPVVTSSDEQYQQPPAVSFELLPGTELNTAQEFQRVEAWQQSGDCEPPGVIGTVTVDPAIIHHLAENIHGDYVMLLGAQAFSPDTEVAQKVANGEEIDLIEAESRRLLQELYDNFSQLVLADIARADPNPHEELTFTGQGTSLGKFENDDVPHCDNPEEKNIRYIVTLVGPTTVFYKGHLPSTLFNSSGELTHGEELPATTEKVPPLVGEVVRFTSQDPHAIPEIDAPAFRLVLDATLEITNKSTS